ncbi:MAG: hypothetical protein VW127_08735, partial [Flavobacteriaceae bacterium]
NKYTVRNDTKNEIGFIKIEKFRYATVNSSNPKNSKPLLFTYFNVCSIAFSGSKNRMESELDWSNGTKRST